MSVEESQPQSEPQAGPAGGSEPTEEELRAAYEAELSRLTSADMIAQAIVSLLNIGARRLGPIGDQPSAEPGAEPRTAAAAPERDLQQVRDAIDAVRALLEILERSVPEGLRPLRDALAQLQMAYAREVQAATPAGPGGSEHSAPAPGAGAGQAGEAGEAGTEEAPQPQEDPDQPGPAQRSGRLWVPGS